MTFVTTIARACGTAVTVAGAASLANRSMRRNAGHDPELQRLDAAFTTSMRIQLETARRHDRRFTITSTELDLASPSRTALEVERRTRVLDAVTVVEDTLVILWWNTDLDGAATAIRRLVAIGALPTSSLELTGAATFPDDGFTEVALVEAASGRRHGLPPVVRPLHAVPDLPEPHLPEPHPSQPRVERRIGAVGR
jgi:hypothetical protein